MDDSADTETTTEAGGARKPFSQFLIEQRQGALHGELSDRLQELVAAVTEHQKQGTLTLTIKVAPLERALDQLVVSDEVKIKPPEGERGASLFFADEEGNLSRQNPMQPQLPLQEVPPERPVQEVTHT